VPTKEGEGGKVGGRWSQPEKEESGQGKPVIRQIPRLEEKEERKKKIKKGRKKPRTEKSH